MGYTLFFIKIYYFNNLGGGNQKMIFSKSSFNNIIKMEDFWLGII